jgi:uncharacterized damage-inducible protein DinB
MFTREGLLELHGRAWGSLRRLLDHIATMPGEVLLKPHEAFGQRTLRDTLVHVAESEDWWIATAQGRRFVVWSSEFLELEKLREALRDVEQRTRDYLEGLSDEALTERVEFRYSGGSFETSPAWIILHMVTHGFHHKGQMASMCRMLGSPASDTDLDVAP